MMEIILASASPRRKEILENIGLSFKIVRPTSEEEFDLFLEPTEAVKKTAVLKAEDVKKKLSGECAIISADTIVVLKGKVLQKPKDEDEAFSMLGSLSGEAHTVYTGFCVMTKDSFSVECIGTKVVFSVLSEETIKNYIQTKEPLDKAGGYGIQGIGSLLIERIEGDYFNVMGLPVKAVMEALYRQTGIRIL